VKFYHFTQYRRLAKILEEGLKPIDESERNYIFEFGDASPEAVVWLTAEDVQPHFECYGVVADVRITLNLRKSRRLVHWASWLKEHDPKLFESYSTWCDDECFDNETMWLDWWFFEGKISPRKIVAVDYIGIPWT
jgi:hypothetical protein